MKLIDNIAARVQLAYKTLTASAPTVKSLAGLELIAPQGSFTEANAYNLAKDGYNANAVAYYCINLVANACAMVPLRVYRRMVTSKGVEYKHLPDHELNKFIRQPNRDLTGMAMQRNLHAFQLIAGSAYLLSRFRNVENTPVGVPFEWDCLRPDRMTIKQEDGILTAYRYNKPMGGVMDYPRSPVNGKCAVHMLKDFHPMDDFFGMSSLQPAIKQIDIANQAARFNKAMLDNSARLTIALKTNASMDAKDIDNVRDQFLNTFAGAINAGRPLVLDKGFEIEELGITPRDMEFGESQANAFRLIANAIGVPTYMLGLKDTQSTFANMAEAKLFLYQSTIQQRLTHFYGDTDGDIEGELNIYFQQFYGTDICIKPVWDKVDALAPQREKRYDRAKNLAGIATIDEQREMVGLVPLKQPGISDLPWLSSTQVPISFALTGPETEEPVDESADDEADKATDNDMQFKLINNDNQAARQRELKTFDRMLTVQEKKFAPKMQAILDLQVKTAAVEYQLKGEQAQIDNIFENTYPQTLALYTKHYINVMRFFGDRVIDAFGKSGLMVYERKDTESLFDLAVRRFIEMFAAKEVRLQSETTKSLIKTAILTGETEGENRREVAKRILGAAGGAVSKRRAMVIARTETHSAANYAQKYAGIAATGEDGSEWVSAEDSRVRATHAAADGQKVKGGDLFNVGGYKCQYPGDPSLPGSERINCRCTTAFVFKDGPEDERSADIGDAAKLINAHGHKHK